MTQRDRGMTLFELVIAMALFALVAVMGLQSLTGMLRSRDRLVSISDQTSGLGQGLSMLRHDLNAIVPMLFFPPGRAAPLSAIVAGPGGFSVSAGGQPGLSGSGTHRVIWTLDPGTDTLTRRVWRVLTPLDAGSQTPDVVVMQGVTAIRFRSHWTGSGWTEGWKNPNSGLDAPTGDSDATGSVPEVYSDSLPLAVEVTLDTRDFGPVPLIEVLK